MKDPQKKKVYAWEDSWWGWDRSTISFQESQRIIQRACRLYRVRAPKIVEHLGRNSSEYDPNTDTISMRSEWELNPAISLHEAAHAIIWKLYGDSVQDHGSEFMGIYLWLLEKFKIASRSALIASTWAYKLQWIPKGHQLIGKR
jgi:hypothetical protein